MKQILKVLGTSFVMAIVVLGVLIILNNISFTSGGKTYKGIFEILGMASTIEKTQYYLSDSDVFESVATSKRPEIYFDKAKLENIIHDKDIEILKYFKVRFNGEENERIAENVDKNHLKILDITDSKGKSFIYLYDRQLQTINFEKPDIYTITFHLIDDEQKETTAIINIPVN